MGSADGRSGGAGRREDTPRAAGVGTLSSLCVCLDSSMMSDRDGEGEWGSRKPGGAECVPVPPWPPPPPQSRSGDSAAGPRPAPAGGPTSSPRMCTPSFRLFSLFRSFTKSVLSPLVGGWWEPPHQRPGLPCALQTPASQLPDLARLPSVKTSHMCAPKLWSGGERTQVFILGVYFFSSQTFNQC